MRCVTVRALVIALVAPVAAATLLAQSGASTATKKPAAAATAAAGAAPVIVVETEKGTFEFTTFPKEAPKSVDHIVTLVKRNFYNGQHFHRVVPDFVVQWGDPASKDMRNAGAPGWGSGGSGKAIGVGEISPLHKHKVGAVGLAYAGSPSLADSQLYVVKSTAKTASLEGNYAVIGQVISGMDVVQRIKQNDMIKRVTVKAGTPAAK